MWQKAQILESRNPALIGRFVWVRAETPVLYQGDDINTNEQRFGAAYATNLVREGVGVVLAQHQAELLPEFTDQVETMDWEAYVMEALRR